MNFLANRLLTACNNFQDDSVPHNTDLCWPCSCSCRTMEAAELFELQHSSNRYIARKDSVCSDLSLRFALSFDLMSDSVDSFSWLTALNNNLLKCPQCLRRSTMSMTNVSSCSSCSNHNSAVCMVFRESKLSSAPFPRCYSY